jgi:hypothetical protein
MLYFHAAKLPSPVTNLPTQSSEEPKIRLFSPAEDDFVIVFSAVDGRVKKVGRWDGENVVQKNNEDNKK